MKNKKTLMKYSNNEKIIDNNDNLFWKARRIKIIAYMSVAGGEG